MPAVPAFSSCAGCSRRRCGLVQAVVSKLKLTIPTNPGPNALPADDGEALLCFRDIGDDTATAEQAGGEFLLIYQFALPRNGNTAARPLGGQRVALRPRGRTSSLSRTASPSQPAPSCPSTSPRVTSRRVLQGFRMEPETAQCSVLPRPRHERFIRAASEPARERTLAQGGSDRHGQGDGRDRGLE